MYICVYICMNVCVHTCMYNVYSLSKVGKCRRIKLDQIAERNKNHSYNKAWKTGYSVWNL